jgi:hypothetical protein
MTHDKNSKNRDAINPMANEDVRKLSFSVNRQHFLDL